MSMFQNLRKLYEPVYDDSVEVSGKGVLQVDAKRLLTKKPVQRQLAAARRLQHGTTSARKRKVG